MVRCQIIRDLTKSTGTRKSFQPLGREVVFTAKAIRSSFEQVLARAGGSLGTWIVLNALSDEGVVSQTAIAGHARVEGATITHHIDRLEAAGLVRRTLDPADRRVRRIELTAEGVALHRRLLGEARRFEAMVFDGIDEAERAELRRLLAHVRANVEAAPPG